MAEQPFDLDSDDIEVLVLGLLVKLTGAFEKIADAQESIAVATQKQADIAAQTQQMLQGQVDATKAMLATLEPKDPLADFPL